MSRVRRTVSSAQMALAARARSLSKASSPKPSPVWSSVRSWLPLATMRLLRRCLRVVILLMLIPPFSVGLSWGPPALAPSASPSAPPWLVSGRFSPPALGSWSPFSSLAPPWSPSLAPSLSLSPWLV